MRQYPFLMGDANVIETEKKYLSSERGGAGVKFLAVLVVLVLIANAGYNYIPIAYEAANLRQEMDTAVVKGLAASGQMKPLEVVRASVERAVRENNVPADAYIEIKPAGSVVQAHVIYTKQVQMLPFGLYKYRYDFNYLATPTGYLLKDGKN
ncbi:MAG: hypothetical protein IPM25_17400 [Chloracidobacterium sp.]|nr:hypothetical protein [Chloracidobacterium sp.]